MTKSIIFLVCFCLTIFNVEALKKNKVANTETLTVAVAPSGVQQGTFLEAETETGFDLNNFYEYSFYVQAYVLYNEYALNTGLGCSTVKRQYWFEKKTDANSVASFCKLIGSQIGSSYLSSYLCGYITGLVPYFNQCTY